MLGQKREGRGHVLVLQKDVVRHAQIRGREVPDAEHAARDERVARLLRMFDGNGDDAEVDVVFLAERGEVVDVLHRHIAEFPPHERAVDVERGDDPKAVFLKPAEGSQRAAE